MYRRCLPDLASQSATPCVWAIVIGGSISTASSEPKMSVDVMGDETRASPEGSEPLARTTPSETRVSHESRGVMMGSFSLERRSSLRPQARRVGGEGPHRYRRDRRTRRQKTHAGGADTMLPAAPATPKA